MILDKSVIKYKTKADAEETLEYKKAADGYIKAYLSLDTFYTYYVYDSRALKFVMGITDDEVPKYQENKELIPLKYRDAILEYQRKLIVDEYVEKNNYYRSLNGLPNYGTPESDFIHVPEDLCEEFSIDPNTPIHELPIPKISVLDAYGYIKSIQEKYPDYEYLKFLGNNKIDIVIARKADNFALIRTPYNITETMWNNFSLIYEQCRTYFVSCIYIPEYKSTIKYYDNFIALCIMVMTIQQIISRVLKNNIDREFYDDYAVKTLFEAYGIPYDSDLDEKITREIVQNLNLLILNKGTNKVIYDISAILGYDRLKIYKYLIMKEQKFDVNGTPIVKYKTDPETGEEVLDYEAMYDVYFKKLYIEDMDYYSSIMDPANNVDYDVVTSGDPYWVEDAALYEELYASEYNYVESKYMGVSISYKMTRMLFDNIYFLKMILDNKQQIPTITIELPRISPYSTFTLFDAIVALCAITCKMNHLKGEILVDPSKIMHVMGFNFQMDYELIRQMILESDYLDDDLIEYFNDPTMDTAEKINTLFTDYIKLYRIILDKMETTQDIREYQAYRDFYLTIYYTDEQRDTFNVGTVDEPVYPKTYLEYLYYKCPELYKVINETDIDQLHVYATHIVGKVNALFPSLETLGMKSGNAEILQNMLLNLIKFFKSYTTDMLGLQIIYVLDLRPENLLRLIDRLLIHVEESLDDKMNLYDYVNYHSRITYCTHLKFIDKIWYITAFTKLFDNLKFIDNIWRIYAHEELNDKYNLYDLIHSIYNEVDVESRLIFRDTLLIRNRLNLRDNINFRELLIYAVSLVLETKLNLYDVILMIESILMKDEGFNLKDIPIIHSETTLFDSLKFRDVVTAIANISLDEKSMTFYDYIINYTQLSLRDIMRFVENMTYHARIYISSEINYIDKLRSIVSNLKMDGNFYLMDSIDNYVSTVAKDDLKLNDTYSIKTSILEKDKISFREYQKLFNAIQIRDNWEIADFIFSIDNDTYMDDSLVFNDLYFLTIRQFLRDKLKFVEKIDSIRSSLDLREYIEYYDTIKKIITIQTVKDGFRFRETYKIIWSD